METLQQLPKISRNSRRITPKELNILLNLRQNSRASLTDISRKTKIPISTIFDKLRASYNGLITRYTALLDFSKIGFNTKANIFLKVSKADKERTKNFLIKNCFVNSVCRINNGFDFLLEAVFPDMKGLEVFMDEVENAFEVDKSEVYYVVEDLKKEGCLTDLDSVKGFIDEKPKSF